METRMLKLASILCAAALTAFAAGAAVAATNGTTAAACQSPPPEAVAPLAFSGGEPSESFQVMYHNVWEYIRDNYYDPSRLENWDAMEHAFDDKISTIDDLHIALDQLTKAAGDKWTYYVSPARGMEIMLRSRQESLAGLELQKNGGELYQIDVIHYKTPAYGTALSERDFVRCIDGIEIKTLSKDRVDEMLRGAAGKKIKVTAVSGDDGADFEVELTIASTPQDATEARIENGIVYIRLPSFDGEGYIAQFLEELKRVVPNGMNSGDGPIKGIVLDLRNNRGGDLPVAVKFVSMMLADESAVAVKSLMRSGAGVSSRDINVVPSASLTINRAPVDAGLLALLRTAPMVVLVNGSTASASEITIGALKDHGRATIIGVTSFGKGVGYRGMPGPVGGGITVTGLKYLTPSGFDVHEKGIEPDIEVKQPRDRSRDAQLEAAIAHLSGEKP